MSRTRGGAGAILAPAVPADDVLQRTSPKSERSTPSAQAWNVKIGTRFAATLSS
jgi:hypothetical protein